MKRYIVLGVNENPKYLYYLPLVRWAWTRLGWNLLLFYARTEQTNQLRELEELMEITTAYEPFQLKIIREFNGYKSETIAQVSRLYAGLVVKNPYDLLMTSDCDMLPLSDYWNPSDLNVTCYGRDLTDYHFPICYAAMTSRKWHEVMRHTDSDYNVCIKQDLDERSAMSNAWLWDQDILTENLNRYGKKLLHRVDRGTDKRTHYPVGRVDRSHWTLDHKVLIDCHLPHDILTNEQSFKKVLDLLHHVWPTQDWKWYIEYHKEFKKLL